MVDGLLADIARAEPAMTPGLRDLRRGWSAMLKGASAAEVLALAHVFHDRLPHARRWLAHELIRFHREAFAAYGGAVAERMAGGLSSWQAVDAFGTILSGPAWAAGRITDGQVEAWSNSEDRWLRRLALVSTVKAGGAARTLGICERLVADRDDMVVKALSWALRELGKRDTVAVAGFLEAHPVAARVRREVTAKLITGLKSGVRRKAPVP